MACMFVWRSGRIQVGEKAPKGSLIVATSPEAVNLLNLAVELGRYNDQHAYFEAAEVADAGEDSRAAVSACKAFADRVQEALREIHHAA